MHLYFFDLLNFENATVDKQIWGGLAGKINENWKL